MNIRIFFEDERSWQPVTKNESDEQLLVDQAFQTMQEEKPFIFNDVITYIDRIEITQD